MIAGEGRRPIGGSSLFWSGSPPNLVIISLVFDFLFPLAVFLFLLILSLFVIVGSWQAQVSPPSRQSAGSGRSPGRAAEEGCGEEEEEGALRLGAQELKKGGDQDYPRGDGRRGGSGPGGRSASEISGVRIRRGGGGRGAGVAWGRGFWYEHIPMWDEQTCDTSGVSTLKYISLYLI